MACYISAEASLVPFGSDRAAIAGSYRIITTSCWNAPGSNRRPPATSNPLEMAVCSRFRPALMCLSGCQPHSHSNFVPIRESCILPHIGHVLLLYLRSTLTTGIPLHAALYSMIWCSFLLGHTLSRLFRSLFLLNFIPLSSSSTMADLCSSANERTALATWCIL